MARLVDADKLIEKLKMHCYPVKYDKNSIDYGITLTGIRQIIDELKRENDEGLYK